MVGQHIFVRCRNDQGNAGTWTAAMTERVVDKDVVRDRIEPRCNMDEAFAQRALLTCTDNNILRIYHIGEGIAVVSRTYWVTDRITETFGRKGAYSISYILTDDDVVSFSSDFGGAFDVNCFESYDALVERIQQGKITINEDRNLFSHRIMDYEPSVFDKAGFTKETFVLFMNGIYSALENKKQLAVVLPAAVRRAWEESGDDSAEKLSYATLALLPDFTRMHLGVTSHWSCQIKDKMVSDMHLIFVHPEKEEDLVYLRREGVAILDLDTGKYTSEVRADLTEYFSFIWDNKEKMDVIEEFWADTKTKYRKLLRGKPKSGRAMESVYLMRRVMEEDFADKANCRRIFLLAAQEFAGAGTKVPVAEDFLQTAIRTLDLKSEPLRPDIEQALCTLTSYDTEQTKHQHLAYGVLFAACEAGTASEETVKILADEVEKEDRNATSYYISYLSEKRELDADKITAQMTSFVAGLFTNLQKSQSNPSDAELFRTVVAVMQEWDETLSGADKRDLLVPFVSAYAAYLGGKSANSEILGTAYKFLFKYEVNVPTQQRDECSKILFREEKKIYKLEYGDNQLRLFAASFFDSIPKITQLNKELAHLIYQRLFRLAYKSDPQIVDGAMAIYMDAIQTASEDIEAEKILAVLLKCQESTLTEIAEASAIWKRSEVGHVLLMFELFNIKLMSRYVATEQRISTLLAWYNKDNPDTYRVVKHYLNTLSAGDRQIIYKGMQQHDLISNLFLHLRFGEKDQDHYGEVENYLGMTYADMTAFVFGSKLLSDSSYDEESVNSNFSEWYKESLLREVEDVEITEQNTFAVKNARILQEARELGKVRFAMPEFRNIAKNVVEEVAYKVFSEAEVNGVATIPVEVIREMLSIVSKATYENELPIEKLLRTISALDSVALNGSLKSLDEMCGKAHGSEEGMWISRRLSYYIEQSGSEERRMWYWLYGIMLNISKEASFPMQAYLQKVGYNGAPDDKLAEFLMNIAVELHESKSVFEDTFGTAMLGVILPKIKDNPQAFDRESIRNAYKKIYVAKYFHGSQELYQLLRKAMNKGGVRFDLKMFLLCIVGAIVSCVAMVGIFMAFVMLGQLGTWMVLSVGALVFVCLAILDFCLLLSLRRKPRR